MIASETLETPNGAPSPPPPSGSSGSLNQPPVWRLLVITLVGCWLIVYAKNFVETYTPLGDFLARVGYSCSNGPVQYRRTVNLWGDTKMYSWCRSYQDSSWNGGPLPWDEFVIPSG